MCETDFDGGTPELRMVAKISLLKLDKGFGVDGEDPAFVVSFLGFQGLFY